MKKHFFVILVILGMSYNILMAQDRVSNTRFERQHKISRFMKEHLPQTEVSLLISINGKIASAQQAALQTLRELERVFPEYPFDTMLVSLEVLLKDPTADRLSRTLAALALEDLHSDAGDAIITDTANACEDKELQTLCSALMVKSNFKM
jgi:hypothetical protein